MCELTTEELINIRGGAILSGSLIISLVKGFSILLDLGRSLGTAVRRVSSNNVCPM